MEPKLKTLFDLLMEGYSTAHLATAVETHGIVGWDRFSRLGSHKPDSTVAAQALDALARFHDEELRFWEEVEFNPPKNQEEMSLRPFPLDVLAELPSNALHRFGWLLEQVPEIRRSDEYPTFLKNRRTANPTKVNIVLGALLECLGSYRKSGKTMMMPSEDQFIDKMLEKFPHVDFVKRSTIQSEFADAKKLVREAEVRASSGG